MASPRISRQLVLSLVLCILFPSATLAQGLPEILWQRGDHGVGIADVEFSADGARIISGDGGVNGTIRTWAAHDGEPAGVLSTAPHAVYSLAMIPGRDLVAFGTIVSGYPPGGVARVWDINSGEEVFSAGGFQVDVSPDGQFLASGGGGVNRYVTISRIDDGATLHHLNTGSYISDVIYSPDGSLVASAGSDNAVQLWDPASGQRVAVIPAHDDDVSALAFSPDGELLATGAGGWDDTDDSSIKIWRVADGALLRTLPGHGDWVYALAFSPDGATLLSSGRSGSLGRIRVWNVDDGAQIAWYDTSAKDLAFSPDGATFVYGSAFGDLVLAANPVAVTAVDDTPFAPVRLTASPNPVGDRTRIGFALSGEAGVRLTIHDMRGRRVATLLEGFRGAGDHAVGWDARDDAGRRVAAGVYLARLEDGETVSRGKLIVLR